MRLRFVPIKVHYALVSCVFAAASVPVAKGGGASITLQPVPPKTVPPSNYPPGTTIVGQEIILGSVPARVWFELHATGWAPENLKTIQARIAATDDDGDGGGYFGGNAECLGQPASGAGDLWPAEQPCNVNADCRAPMSGIAAACVLGEPSFCGPRPPHLPGVGNICEPWFQNRCHPRWIGTGIVFTSAVDIGSINTRFGGTAQPGETIPDFHPSYIGTLVLNVPANAKGTYTIDFDEGQTYLQDPQSQNIPVSTYSARVTIACGRCCSGYESEMIECVDHMTQNQCEGPTDQVFIADQFCPDSGGADCPQCAADINCDDRSYCNGQEVCGASGVCGPGTAQCQPYEECDEAMDSCPPRIPAVSTWGLLVLAIGLLIVAKRNSLMRRVGIR